jgi:glycosyltransferase involved in cell wall biosynthesis
MRVLWFTNIPMPAVDRSTGKVTVGSGHWMTTLLEELSSRPDVELAVATAYPGLPDLDFAEGRVRYLVASQPRFSSQLKFRSRDLETCARFVRTVGPDVVHIHGSERFFGLLAARRLIAVPTVISLQGVLVACLPTFFGALRWREVLGSNRIRETLTGRGLLWGYQEYVHGAVREKEILTGAPAFLGRTQWDLAQIRRFNPEAKYFHVGELLRPEFSSGPWKVETCQRDRIFVTNVGNPRRGVETILEAAAILRQSRPRLELHFAGALSAKTGYGRFLIRRIAEMGLSNCVKVRGFLDGPHLARELLASHAYVIASLIENSPNSLCEAMRLGLPCVASYVGGIPSLVSEGETGLFFPAGDAALLAARLDEILSDDDLATRLGRAARVEAARRHDPVKVVAQLVAAYEAVRSRGLVLESREPSV